MCDNPVGYCARASCQTDADCEPPYVCGSYEPIGGQCAAADAFACQTPRDQCAKACRPPGTFCTFTGSRRMCTDDCGIP